jgi:hypothetical protein
MLVTPRINKILFALFCLATLGSFIGALVSPSFRAIAYAPLRDWLLPPPDPIVISVLYSTEKAEWLA